MVAGSLLVTKDKNQDAIDKNSRNRHVKHGQSLDGFGGVDAAVRLHEQPGGEHPPQHNGRECTQHFVAPVAVRKAVRAPCTAARGRRLTAATATQRSSHPPARAQRAVSRSQWRAAAAVHAFVQRRRPAVSYRRPVPGHVCGRVPLAPQLHAADPVAQPFRPSRLSLFLRAAEGHVPAAGRLRAGAPDTHAPTLVLEVGYFQVTKKWLGLRIGVSGWAAAALAAGGHRHQRGRVRSDARATAI